MFWDSSFLEPFPLGRSPHKKHRISRNRLHNHQTLCRSLDQNHQKQVTDTIFKTKSTSSEEPEALEAPKAPPPAPEAPPPAVEAPEAPEALAPDEECPELPEAVVQREASHGAMSGGGLVGNGGC